MTLMQLRSFSGRPVVPPYRIGWLRCECDLVHWVWPREAHGDAPEIGPVHMWTCWRHINRCTQAQRARA